MASPPILVWLAVILAFVAIAKAGPLGPLPNVTSSDFGFKDGSCAVGDVSYASGEEVPGGGGDGGSSGESCERCRCEAGAVRCERPRCEPRPGCKALHRPDHCCPTYQCECEQEGRVYGNGEKLVDPLDPCRVCYCQGGEVVCRRIACFVRDDCTPRLVPGRCCPEYDNCPLRGVTTVAGVTPTMTAADEPTSSIAPTPPKENIKQEITIKEITPVSEIPIIGDVKLKEILPSAGIEVPDYSSSKSPLIVREATTERITSYTDNKVDTPGVIEIFPSSSSYELYTTSLKPIDNVEKTIGDSTPSKISFSTQDAIDGDVYLSSLPTAGSSSRLPDSSIVTSGTTKATVIEEEDSSLLFDHNPAFPPIPDDLSVLRNHEDEILPEQAVDGEHVSMTQESVAPTTVDASPASHVDDEPPITSTSSSSVHVKEPTSPEQPSSRVDDNKEAEVLITKIETTSEIPLKVIKDSPMLNLRSAIPTEILNVPSLLPEEINNEPDEIAETTTIVNNVYQTSEFIPANTEKSTETPVIVTMSTKNFESMTDIFTSKIETSNNVATEKETSTDSSKSSDITTNSYKGTEVPIFTTVLMETSTLPKLLDSTTENKTAPIYVITTNIPIPDHNIVKETKIASATDFSKTSTIPATRNDVVSEKSSIVTEITAQTEFSSLPIETSDQNPQDNSELVEKEKLIVSTIDPSPADIMTTKMATSLEPEVITVSKALPSSTDSFENIETTEFVLTPFGSSESATDTVELIKISADPSQNAPIIEPETKKNSVLTDLINLVDDVAAIGDHTENPDVSQSESELAPVSAAVDSDELIPVNAGYKSKNNNWNLNSITEIPLKNKNSPQLIKQKVVEIEDDDSEGITDSPPPNDKVEPTTRRPVIDHVSDDNQPDGKTEKKDIEIITKSYVPTISKRPTKVVMQKKSKDDTNTSDNSSSNADAVDTRRSVTTTAASITTSATSDTVDTLTSAPVALY